MLDFLRVSHTEWLVSCTLVGPWGPYLPELYHSNDTMYMHGTQDIINAFSTILSQTTITISSSHFYLYLHCIKDLCKV